MRRRLGEVLTFMTGDRDYAFMFQSGYRTPATSLFNHEDFRIESHRRPLLSFSLEASIHWQGPSSSWRPLIIMSVWLAIGLNLGSCGRWMASSKPSSNNHVMQAGSATTRSCVRSRVSEPRKNRSARELSSTRRLRSHSAAPSARTNFSSTKTILTTKFMKIHALLDGWCDDLVSEHPTVSFAGARVVVDHTLGRYGRDEFASGRAAASTRTVAHRSRGGFGGANPFALDRDVACESCSPGFCLMKRRDLLRHNQGQPTQRIIESRRRVESIMPILKPIVVIRSASGR